MYDFDSRSFQDVYLGGRELPYENVVEREYEDSGSGNATVSSLMRSQILPRVSSTTIMIYTPVTTTTSNDDNSSPSSQSGIMALNTA